MRTPNWEKKIFSELLMEFQNILDKHNVSYKKYRYDRLRIYDSQGKEFILKLMWHELEINSTLCEINKKILLLEHFETWLFDNGFITELRNQYTYEELKKNFLQITYYVYGNIMIRNTLDDFYLSKYLTKEDLEELTKKGIAYEEWDSMMTACDDYFMDDDYSFIDDYDYDDDDYPNSHGYTLRASDHLVINEDGEYELPI